MVQKIETYLEPCPFCGGKAELLLADHPIDDRRHLARVQCPVCASSAVGVCDGPYMFPPDKVVTLEEALKLAAAAWNRRERRVTA